MHRRYLYYRKDINQSELKKKLIFRRQYGIVVKNFVLRTHFKTWASDSSLKISVFLISEMEIMNVGIKEIMHMKYLILTSLN